MLEQKYSYNESLLLKLVVIQHKKFFVINLDLNSFYFFIPVEIKVTKYNNSLILSYSQDSKEKGELICKSFKDWLTSKEKQAIKKLILKGLGLKVNVINSNELEFKLGFSHIVLLKIPKSIKITVLKNVIILESFNKVELGNIANEIKMLKKPNPYKGKGIWYKNEKVVLKTIKKA